MVAAGRSLLTGFNVCHLLCCRASSRTARTKPDFIYLKFKLWPPAEPAADKPSFKHLSTCSSFKDLVTEATRLRPVTDLVSYRKKSEAEVQQEAWNNTRIDEHSTELQWNRGINISVSGDEDINVILNSDKKDLKTSVMRCLNFLSKYHFYILINILLNIRLTAELDTTSLLSVYPSTRVLAAMYVR